MLCIYFLILSCKLRIITFIIIHNNSEIIVIYFQDLYLFFKLVNGMRTYDWIHKHANSDLLVFKGAFA